MNIPSYEKRWLVSFIIFVMILTTIPYLIGFLLQGSDWFFSGFVFGVEDGNSYIAKMLTGSYGSWLFRTPYTIYPQSGALAFLPYILLGKLAAPPGLHEQLVVLFHLFRLAAISICIIATYQFIALWVHDPKIRRIALVVATLGGGLGWLAVVGLSHLWGDRLPLEFYSPESFGFLSIYGLPHLAAGRAFLLWGFILFFSKVQSRSQLFRQILNAGLCWNIVGFMQPLTIVVGWLLLAIFNCLYLIYICIDRRWFIDQKSVKQWLEKSVLLVIISSPLVIYNIIRFSTDPFLREWTKQNIISSPPVSDYLLAYGFLLPSAIIGCIQLIRSRNIPGFILVGWLSAFPFLAYAPYNLQRRLPEGIWVVIVILSCIFIQRLNRKWKWVSITLLLASLLAPIIFFAGGISTLLRPAPPLYLSRDEVRIFLYLQNDSEKGQIVIADYDTSNALPAWAPVRTVIGHGPESIHLNVWRPIIESVLNEDGKLNDIQQLAKDVYFKYILISPTNQKINSRWSNELQNEFKLKIKSGNWQIYQVW
jgi:hypothetical protein